MIRFASALLAASLLAGGAVAQTDPHAGHAGHAAAVPAPPPVAAAPGKLSTTSTVAELMANEKAKAVLTKHVPQIVNSPQLPLAMEMRFTDLQQFPEAALTAETVKAIDADLAKN